MPPHSSYTRKPPSMAARTDAAMAPLAFNSASNTSGNPPGRYSASRPPGRAASESGEKGTSSAPMRRSAIRFAS